MSPITKLDVASLAVKVRARVALLDVAPSLTSVAVIASVGAVVSGGTNHAAEGTTLQFGVLE